MGVAMTTKATLDASFVEAVEQSATIVNAAGPRLACNCCRTDLPAPSFVAAPLAPLVSCTHQVIQMNELGQRLYWHAATRAWRQLVEKPVPAAVRLA